MTIYEKLIDGAEKGMSYYIDFKTKSLTLNKKKLVDNGVYDGDYGVSVDNPRENIEKLFDKYYFSNSCTRTDMKSTYFHHVDDEMTLAEELCGESRFIAQAKLEGYILGLILGKCQWKDIAYNEKHFVWQSKQNSNLFVWKEWFKEY